MTNLERRLQRLETAEQADSAQGYTEIILWNPDETPRAEVDERVRAAKAAGRRYVVAVHRIPSPDPLPPGI